MHVFSVLSPGLHDDNEYHSMFCCMIFGMPSAHGSLPVAPVCPIAINPIMRSGAGGLTSRDIVIHQLAVWTTTQSCRFGKGVGMLVVYLNRLWSVDGGIRC